MERLMYQHFILDWQTMSQKVSRKTAVNEEKDKRQATSPVKEMKKKMAANAEKEKQAAEKAIEKEKPAEKTEKTTEKAEKAPPKTKEVEKAAEKTDKQDKSEKPDKSAEKEKPVEKKAEKQAEKKPEPQPEKSKTEASVEEKNGKPEKQESKKPEAPKQKQNGRERVHNGVSDVTLGTNGTDDVLNGTVSADSEDEDVMLVIDDHDELFPELTYDDTSDVECFEPPTPENAPSRSFTRRSQVKATRTPETPRPASDKQTDRDTDDPSHKVLKLKDDAPPTDRKLRSADSPKPDGKKKPQDSPKKQEGLEKVEEGKTLDEFGKKESQEEKNDVEVVDVEASEGRKPDTNFSKSRVKVSPYRRSLRAHDHNNTSLLANYTGNNTTMEMDITESSSILEDAPLDDSAYLRGLRSIRGRSSYKPLKELALRHVANRSTRSNASAGTSAGNTPIPLAADHSRPTGTVVGRKRKPDADDSVEIGVDVAGACSPGPAPGKRMRVLERLAEPFRRVAAAAALPAANRRNAEIVGINTDLPLSAPVVSTPTFDPEALKTSEPAPAAPALPAATRDDTKRCNIM
ncbi:unnamed protein product [Chrysodeixis includens]|uniref:Uncharacterized protein n=1 Tax=Chrysodeixis includens TaxID=689277 RepID=A0A9N8L5D7_CHRIL|nr:unnamed protein product [Chrysodeixis includens]